MTDQAALARQVSTGILAFPATPFTLNGGLDAATMARHVGEVAQSRPAALVPAGGAGELFSLNVAEHAEVVRLTVGAAAGIPVIAGIGGGLATAIDMGRNAEKAGADGLLVLPPYLVNAEQEGLAHYVEAVCRGVGLPVIAYSRDNGVLRVPTLLRLADSCANLVGVKDGTGDLDLVLETRRRLDGRLVVINGAPTAEMLAAQSFAIGVTSYSSAVFAFAPKLAQAFYDAVAGGDAPMRDALLEKFYFPYSAIRRRRAGNAVSIVKAGLRVTGQPVGPVRPPLLDLPDKDAEELRVLIEAGTALATGQR